MTADPADRIAELRRWAADPDVDPNDWQAIPAGVLRALLPDVAPPSDPAAHTRDQAAIRSLQRELADCRNNLDKALCDPAAPLREALDNYDFFMRGLLIGQDRLQAAHRREIAKVNAALATPAPEEADRE